MSTADRLTITLGPGQREALERLAQANGTTLAYVVRYALREFVEQHQEPQLELKFPELGQEGKQ